MPTQTAMARRSAAAPDTPAPAATERIEPGEDAAPTALEIAAPSNEMAPEPPTGHGAANTTARVGFAPIVRVDAARREVELCATSEAVDSYGTVFDYAASKDAFTRWLGNVREMHERRAVGRRVSVRCDDTERKIYVRVRISRGAEDTWEKVLDGTLRGASIGASNVVWSRQARSVAGRERQLQVATRYDLVELSLVDNPSNPDALGITLVRDAVPDAALLDDLTTGKLPDERPLDAPAPRQGSAEQEAAASPCGHGGPRPYTPGRDEPGVRASGSAAALPDAQLADLVERDLLGMLPPQAAAGDQSATSTYLASTERKPMERAQGPFSPNAEGYPDVGVPERAEERPTGALAAAPEGNARERFHAAARAILLGCDCPLCAGALAALGADDASADAARATGVAGDAQETALARALAAGLGASVARLERVDASVRGLSATVETIVSAAVERMASATGELRERVEALEAQPMPGGPALRAAEKSHPLLGAATGFAGQPGPSEQYRALESLAGRLTDPQAQIAVAAEMIRLQRGE